MALGFMVITNDPLAVAERFSARSPQLMLATDSVACVFVPCDKRVMNLKDMQLAVNGHIELVLSVPNFHKPYWVSTDFFCNEDGMSQRLPELGLLFLPVDRPRILGDVLVCGTDSEGDSVALSTHDLFQSLSNTSYPSYQHTELSRAKEWVDAGLTLVPSLTQAIVNHAITQINRLKDVYARL